MKVIFLDVDGVLNSEEDFIYKSGPKKGSYKVRGPHVGNEWTGRYIGISNKRVKRLAKIVQETGAIIVLVSSWKRDYAKFLKTNRNTFGRYLRDKLAAQGLTIHSTTLKHEGMGDPVGTYARYRRGSGILHWLEEHEGEVESWIALDDEGFDYIPFQQPRVVYTWNSRGFAGLNDELVDAAIKMLNDKNLDFDTVMGYDKDDQENIE